MAFKEVVPPKEAAGEFFQFKAVGDKLAGYFVGVDAAKGTYAKPGDIAVHVLGRGANGPAVITVSPAPYTLKRAVQHAIGNGTLVRGVAIQSSYSGNQKIEGRDSEMKVIKTVIDLDDAGKPIVKPGVLDSIKKHAAASAPAAPKPPPADDSDLPF